MGFGERLEHLSGRDVLLSIPLMGFPELLEQLPGQVYPFNSPDGILIFPYGPSWYRLKSFNSPDGIPIIVRGQPTPHSLSIPLMGFTLKAQGCLRELSSFQFP